MNRQTLVLMAAFLFVPVLGCHKAGTSSSKDGKENQGGGPVVTSTGNPITTASGPIGQGGDPAAMAARRGAQQLKAANDFRQLGQFYAAYRAEANNTSPEGFLKYLQDDPNARSLVQAIKDGTYVLHNARMADSNTPLVYEKTADYNKTRVVGMGDGAVHKTMPEDDFQKLIMK